MTRQLLNLEASTESASCLSEAVPKTDRATDTGELDRAKECAEVDAAKCLDLLKQRAQAAELKV